MNYLAKVFLYLPGVVAGICAGWAVGELGGSEQVVGFIAASVSILCCTLMLIWKELSDIKKKL
jgi:hypothetical protein